MKDAADLGGLKAYLTGMGCNNPAALAFVAGYADWPKTGLAVTRSACRRSAGRTGRWRTPSHRVGAVGPVSGCSPGTGGACRGAMSRGGSMLAPARGRATARLLTAAVLSRRLSCLPLSGALLQRVASPSSGGRASCTAMSAGRAFSEPLQLFAEAKAFHRHRHGKARAVPRCHEAFPIDRTRQHDEVSGCGQSLLQCFRDLRRPGGALGRR